MAGWKTITDRQQNEQQGTDDGLQAKYPQ